jgi:hypothetical protein
LGCLALFAPDVLESRQAIPLEVCATKAAQLRYLGVSHSASFDQRCRPETFFTAIATAFFWPTRTTSFLPRVTPV